MSPYMKAYESGIKLAQYQWHSKYAKEGAGKSDPKGFDQQLDNFRNTLEEQGIPKSRISDLVSHAYEYGRQTGNYNPSLEGLEQKFPRARQLATPKDMPKQVSNIQTKTPLQALNLPRKSPQIDSKLTLGTNPIQVAGGGLNKLRRSEVSSSRADLKKSKDINAKPNKINYLNQGNKG